MNLYDSLLKGLAEQLNPQPVDDSESPVWIPDPENAPQCLAYVSPADELFYGGAAGGGKTDLLLGLAGTQHRNSLILRREFPQARGMIERSREIFNRVGQAHNRDSFNESRHIWRLISGRVVEFGSLKDEKHKENYRGRPHDFYGWDEVTQFTRSQYQFVNMWNRTTLPGQRCRIVATGNPPMTLEGRWILDRWGAWLNRKHGKRAESGEVRWFVEMDGEDIEVPNGDAIEHKHKDGRVETIRPRSRTFIKALLKDNKYLRDSSYAALLQATPEPMRSMLLDGLFDAEFEGDPFQVIPTRWVLEAMERWRRGPKPDAPLDVLGCDVARGGDDKTVIAPKRANWYDALIKYPGKMTPSGQVAAGFFLIAAGGEEPVINLDLVGWGASAYDHLAGEKNYPQLIGTNFGEGADDRRDKTGRLQFANMRAWAYWNMREALDPANGHNLCLPDDDELLADLTSPRWRQQPTGKIIIESKDDIKKRIGRSTDCGDAVVLAEMVAPQSRAGDWLKAWKKEADER